MRPPNDRVRARSIERWLDDGTLEFKTTVTTPRGELSYALRLSREEPVWVIERPVKDWARDLPAGEETWIYDGVADTDSLPL